MDSASSNRADVWQTAGGDNSRRGCFGGAAAPRLRLKTRLRAQGALQASVVFDRHGTAFVADMAGWAQAFSSQGERRWQTQLDGPVSATPALHATEPALFAATQRGSVYALSADTGAVRWRREIPTRSDPRILSDLLFHAPSGRVILSSWGGRFIALDAAMGAERASWDAGISPAAGLGADRQGRLYALRAVGGKGIQLVCLAADGTETVLHTEPESSRGARRALVAAGPVADDAGDTLYAVLNGDTTGALCAWSIESKALRWRTSIPACVQATPAVRSDGTVLVADLSGHLQAVAPDGAVRWRRFLGCEYLLAGAVSDNVGTCFIGDPLGQLHAVGADGKARVIVEAERAIQSRPSFDPSGRLFLPSTDRSVYVLG